LIGALISHFWDFYCYHVELFYIDNIFVVPGSDQIPLCPIESLAVGYHCFNCLFSWSEENWAEFNNVLIFVNWQPWNVTEVVIRCMMC